MGIYEELGVRRLINARCVLSDYGDSLTRKRVLEAMCEAAECNVNMPELHEAVGQRLARLTHNEAAMVCAGAAHGGQLAIAGCMTGLDEDKRDRLPDTAGMRDEVIMHKRGRWPEDRVIRQTGAKVVEISGQTSDQIEVALSEAISERTVAIFLWGRQRQAPIPIPLAVEIGHSHKVPVIVDAAYELPPKENLWFYTQDLGVDAVVFSGGKTLRGPGSTGFVVGRKDIVDGCRFHARPEYGIGYAGKVSKEEVVGLYVAVELLLEEDASALHTRYRKQMEYIVGQLQDIPHIRLEPMEHGIWGDDFGVHLHVDSAAGLPPMLLQRTCVTGDPYIEIGPRGTGIFVCVSSLKPGDEKVVAARVRRALQQVLEV